MSRIFSYLSDQEEQSLLEQGGVAHYEPEATILSEGAEQSAIHVIRAGTVRVEKESAGYPLHLFDLQPGQIFGEMSFVQGVPASANVVAEGPVETRIIRAEDVRPLLQSNPQLYGRFYQSLAQILSQRLRDTSTLAVSDWRPRDWAAEAR